MLLLAKTALGSLRQTASSAFASLCNSTYSVDISTVGTIVIARSKINIVEHGQLVDRIFKILLWIVVVESLVGY